jgi:hypothetical protein
VILIAGCLLLTLAFPPASRLQQRGELVASMWFPVGTAALFVVSILFMTRVSEFLYFQF